MGHLFWQSCGSSGWCGTCVGVVYLNVTGSKRSWVELSPEQQGVEGGGVHTGYMYIFRRRLCISWDNPRDFIPRFWEVGPVEDWAKLAWPSSTFGLSKNRFPFPHITHRVTHTYLQGDLTCLLLTSNVYIQISATGKCSNFSIANKRIVLY
jgi:hypothetical protein